jgi:hypothetical protein
LRFLAIVATGWVGMRVVLLWPEEMAVPGVAAEAVAVGRLPSLTRDGLGAGGLPQGATVSTYAGLPTPGPSLVRKGSRKADRIAAALFATREEMAVESASPSVAPMPTAVGDPLPHLLPPSPFRSGMTISLWAMARPGAATGGPVQLGGGQAGARVRVPLTRRIAAVARLATPLAGAGREVALGIEWRPTRLPVTLVAERRVALDRSGSGTGIGVIAGIDGMPVVAGFTLESYGQAGAGGGQCRARFGSGADAGRRLLTRRLVAGGRTG